MKRIRAVWLILAMMLAGSLAVNLYLFRELKSAYADELAVRLRPTRSFALQTGGDYPLVIVGDSRVEMWPLPKGALNLGASGETTSQILLRLEANLRHNMFGKAIIQAGINDLKAIGFMPHREKEIAALCEQNLREIARVCRLHSSQVVLTTVFPTGQVDLKRRLLWSDRIEAARLRVNGALITNPPPGVSVVDCDRILADPNGRIRPEFFGDTLHLSALGYEALNSRLRDVRDKNGNSRY